MSQNQHPPSGPQPQPQGGYLPGGPGQHPGHPYPGQPSPSQQYPGPAYGTPPVPERQIGKRVLSMALLVISYVLGSLALLSLPGAFVSALVSEESAGYTVGYMIGSTALPVAFTVAIIYLHRWRGRIKREEYRAAGYRV